MVLGGLSWGSGLRRGVSWGHMRSQMVLSCGHRGGNLVNGHLSHGVVVIDHLLVGLLLVMSDRD